MSKSLLKIEKDEPLIINRLGAIIKEERSSNKALAEILGYDETTVSKWVTNTVQPPLTTFLRISLIYNRDLPDFVVSTKNITSEKRKEYLKILANIALQAKKTGKSKETAISESPKKEENVTSNERIKK